MYRSIGRYRRSKHRKSPTFLNTTRHLLYVANRVLFAQKKWGVRDDNVDYLESFDYLV